MDIPKLIGELEVKLTKQSADIAKYRDYYDGKHKLSFATSKYREEFDQMLREVCDNWCPIVVDAVSERMHVEGFRFSKDGKADSEAWDIWQECFLDSDSELLHTETLVAGLGFVMVWGQDTGTGAEPVITVEDPTQVYVSLYPGSRRHRQYALKKWSDDWTSDEYLNLYTADNVFKFRRKGGKLEELETITNPLGVVNVVPFYNRPRTMPHSYRSEIYDILSTQDQINKILCDAIVASEFAAYRQRWATGVEVELDETTKKPVNPWETGSNRILIAPDPDSKFGAFDATDLSNYVRLLENRIQSVASRTRTPPHYLLGQSGSFPSGESLKATETGLIAKTKSRMRHFGESWEEVMRLAFAVEGDAERASYYRAETIWADPESRTEAEHVDALLKLRTLGVPIRQLWEDAGYSQEQIERMTMFAAEESMQAAMGQPSNIVITSGTAEPSNDVDASAVGEFGASSSDATN